MLPDGVTLTLVVRTAGGERYLVEWRGGAVAAVFDADGQPRADLDPATLLDARVYGQGEIDAIAASPAAQLALLDRVGGTAEGGGPGGTDGNTGPGVGCRREAAARINEPLKDRVRVRVPVGGTHADGSRSRSTSACPTGATTTARSTGSPPANAPPRSGPCCSRRSPPRARTAVAAVAAR